MPVIAALLALWAPPASLAEERHNGLYAVADIDAQTAGKIATVLSPVLSVSILFMIVRIVLSWYPQLDGKKLPWVVVVAPTEPVLGPTRRAFPPVGGVDISPVRTQAVTTACALCGCKS